MFRRFPIQQGFLLQLGLVRGIHSYASGKMVVWHLQRDHYSNNAVQGYVCLATVLVLPQANWTHLCPRHRKAAGYIVEYRFLADFEGHGVACKIEDASSFARAPGSSGAEGRGMAMSLACCVLLYHLRPWQFPMLSGRCFPLLIMSCVGCFFKLMRSVAYSQTAETGRPRPFRSQIGTARQETSDIVPIRGCLDNKKQLMAGDVYIGRGSRQRGLHRSAWANDYKVSVYGRAAAVQRFGVKLRRESPLKDLLWTLSGVRLVCHCLPS